MKNRCVLEFIGVLMIFRSILCFTHAVYSTVQEYSYLLVKIAHRFLIKNSQN